MSAKLTHVVVWLMLLAGASAVEWVKSLDLDRMVKDQDYLQRIVIYYVAADQPNILYVYGSGNVVTQPAPSYQSTDIVATCSAGVKQEEVKHLLQMMRDRHFFDLPMRSYLMIYAGPVSSVDAEDKSKLHSIYVSDGNRITYRSFGTGTYGDEQLSIPEDFAAIENELRQLRDRALNDAPGKPCRLAARIKWPPS